MTGTKEENLKSGRMQEGFEAEKSQEEIEMERLSALLARAVNQCEGVVVTSDGEAYDVVSLVRDGVDINKADANGNTALMWAAKFQDADVVTDFLRRGAKINAATTNGATALIWASTRNNVETVSCLLEKGANINAATANGNTALMCAAKAWNKSAAADRPKNVAIASSIVTAAACRSDGNAVWQDVIGYDAASS